MQAKVSFITTHENKGAVNFVVNFQKSQGSLGVTAQSGQSRRGQKTGNQVSKRNAVTATNEHKAKNFSESRVYVPLLITNGMWMLVIRNAEQVWQRGEGQGRSFHGASRARTHIQIRAAESPNHQVVLRCPCTTRLASSR